MGDNLGGKAFLSANNVHYSIQQVESWDNNETKGESIWTQIKKIKKWKQAEEKQMQRNNYYVSY
jgi:hypothetical protein